MLRVAIYSRISLDASGTQTATQRQRSACEDYARARNWEVVATLEDVDLSASKARVVRPAYERLLGLIEDGSIDGILVWKLDRLMRRPAEFERMWQRCERRNVFLSSVTEPIDTTNELGLAFVRILITFAGLESASIGLRVAAKHRARAEAGRPNSVAPAYGVARGWKRLVPGEAAILREAAERVIAGESVNRIARALNDRHVPAKQNGFWHGEVLRKMLTSARMVGDRAYHGEVVAQDCFPPILDRVTFAKVRDSFGDRSQHSVPHRVTAKYRGVVVCGLCGRTCIIVNRWQRNQPAYTCPPHPTGCGRISVGLQYLEDHIDREVGFHKAVMRAAASKVVPDGAVIDAYERHHDAIRALSEAYYVDGRISRVEFYAAREVLSDDLAQGVPSDPERPLRRALILRSKLGNRFDPARVVLSWRHDAVAFTVKQVAELLLMSTPTVYKWIREGELPAALACGQTVVYPGDLNVFIERRRIVPNSEPAPEFHRRHQQTGISSST
jgi:excisionase family DNA binding protein